MHHSLSTRNITAITLALFSIAGLSSCGGGSGQSQSAENPPVNSGQPPQKQTYQIQLGQVSQMHLQSQNFTAEAQAQTTEGLTANSSNYTLRLNPSIDSYSSR
jgi:hypothetical protein